uniref:Glycogen [starch] synthase n=1 Tax=Setaria digitata TaxID=48799 RepID=A0A915Q5T7_9BILA
MKPSPVLYWVALLYSSLATTALLGNIWVISVVLNQIRYNFRRNMIHKRHMKGTVRNSVTVYLLMLSMADLTSILPVPFLVIDIFHNDWPFGIILCKLIFLYEGANKSLSPLLLTAFSVDRCFATSTDPRCKDVTVVAFIIYPAAANSFNVESLKGQAVCKQLHDTVSRIKENLASRMFEACLKGRIPEMEDLLLPDERIQLKRCILSAKRDVLPPICTHNMLDDAGDPVLNAFRRTQLINQPYDRVKVIFHPEFLSSVSPLMNLDYEDFVRGCHMGVFPSYYEPWGYTPAECTVMGVPSVTTNLSGFGCFIQEQVQDPHAFGIFVIDRRFKGPNESIDELAKTLYDFTLLSRRQRIIMRNRTERLSELLDWKTLGSFYREARRKALEATHPNFMQVIEETVKKMPRPTSAPSTPTLSRSASTTPHDSDESDTSEQEAFEAKAWAEAN